MLPKNSPAISAPWNHLEGPGKLLLRQEYDILNTQLQTSNQQLNTGANVFISRNSVRSNLINLALVANIQPIY